MRLDRYSREPPRGCAWKIIMIIFLFSFFKKKKKIIKQISQGLRPRQLDQTSPSTSHPRVSASYMPQARSVLLSTYSLVAYARAFVINIRTSTSVIPSQWKPRQSVLFHTGPDRTVPHHQVLYLTPHGRVSRYARSLVCKLTRGRGKTVC